MASLNNIEKFGFSFQTKVITSLLTNKQFLQNINDVLSDEYFSNQAHKWIVNETMRYFTKYHTYPSMDVFKVEIKKLDNEVLALAVKEQLKEAYKTSDTANDLQYVEEEFAAFCKNQQLKKALLSSVDLLNEGDYDSIRHLINNALKSGQKRDLGLLYEKDIELRYREDTRCPIPFPWPTFNKITQGGYGKGDLVLIFGNPKGGKSWTIVAMAAEAVKLGYNIVYYALELGEDYVGKRFDAYFTGIPVDQVDKHRDKVEAAIAKLPGKLIIKGYPPKRASLNTIEQHLHQIQDQAEVDGQKLEINGIFIDYLDLLKNRNKTRTERKDDIDDVYTDAKGLAKELMIPIISPSQANRSGAEKEILESSHIAGSFDKIMIGDIVISLSRGRKDKLNGTGRWHFMGNRYGADGVTYMSSIDTATGHIEIESEQMDVTSEPENQPFKTNEINKNERDFLKKKFFELKDNE